MNGARSCTACGAKGWLGDDTDIPPGHARTCGSCNAAALRTYARLGNVRLDYCDECAAVTVLDEHRPG